MNFDSAQIWVIITILSLAILAFVIFKRRKTWQPRNSSKQFLTMGIIWLLIGLGYYLWRNDIGLFDIAIFNLGIIFTVIGSTQYITRRVKHSS
jgi:hypothetical protein